MLIILFIFALTHTLAGSPLSPHGPTDVPIRDTRYINNHFEQRTVQDIVISCLATIFACTWTAIHPNIPALTDCWWTRFKRQVMTMVYALLAPELITIWALQQRMAAKEIIEEYNKEILGVVDDTRKETFFRSLWMAGVDLVKCISRGIHHLFYDSPFPERTENGPRWTMAHGFFVQMGGFMLSEKGKPVHTVIDGRWWRSPNSGALPYYIQQGFIYAPQTTEEDIMDRSKGDAISKLFIVLQTTWFIVQCISRWSQHLAVTELEIITLGFAALNGITYVLWWHKPQNVGRPVFLELKSQDTVPAAGIDPSNDVVAKIKNSEDTSMAAERDELDAAPLLQNSNAPKELWLGRIQQAIENSLKKPWLLPVAIPYRIIHTFFRGFMKLIRNDGHGNEYRVPMFHSAGANGSYSAFLICISAIGPIFGAIHLIPTWFLRFASPQEMWLWRVSAIIITMVPMCIGVSEIVEEFDKISYIVSIFTVIGLFLYPIARIILLILSLTNLHSLPPEALQTIEWTTFIPHL